MGAPGGRSRVSWLAAPGDEGERRAPLAARAEQHSEKEAAGMPKRSDDNECSDRLIDDEMRYMTKIDGSLLFSKDIFILSGQPAPNVRKRTY
jgi:hypothetical protein